MFQKSCNSHCCVVILRFVGGLKNEKLLKLLMFFNDFGTSWNCHHNYHNPPEMVGKLWFEPTLPHAPGARITVVLTNSLKLKGGGSPSNEHTLVNCTME